MPAMPDNSVYEKLRMLLNSGTERPLPQHEASYSLLESMFNPEQAEIVVLGLGKIETPASVDSISHAVGLPEASLRDILEDLAYRGLLEKAPEGKYLISPSILATYFTFQRSDPARTQDAAEAIYELRESYWVPELSENARINVRTRDRTIPAIKPAKRFLQVNESIEASGTVLPLEVLRERISAIKPQAFLLMPCGCREPDRLAGHPCDRTDGHYCIAVGTWAEQLAAQGIGRIVSMDELIEICEEAEEAGLVHQAAKDGNYFCNCCPCCCDYLKAFIKSGGATGTESRSGFVPERSEDLCVMCGECLRICPTKAVRSNAANHEDEPGKGIQTRPELCLGCGLCASNCPNEAIVLTEAGKIQAA